MRQTISTPAPSRGATGYVLIVFYIIKISTPAPSRGATSIRRSLTFFMRFQLPPLHEGRPWFSPRSLSLSHFNSLPYTRGDQTTILSYWSYVISTPAPTRGATRFSLWGISYSRFQLPPLHEGRPIRKGSIFIDYEFQLPPLHEGRRSGISQMGSRRLFQLPPLHEGRHTLHSIIVRMGLFQLPPLHEGRHNRKTNY